MNLFSITLWHMGTKSLFLHPLRSMLTILGIFVGIASVIWLLAIGEGMSVKVQRQIKELGTTNIIVRSVKPLQEETLQVSSTAFYGITRDDYDVLVSTIGTIERALQIRDVERDLHYGHKELSIHLVGCTSQYATAMNIDTKSGRFISALDEDHKDNVCVLSSELAKSLFPLGDSTGKVLRIRDIPYTVVGVMKPRRATAAIGSSLSAQEFSDNVYIPITTFWQRIGDLTTELSLGSREREWVELSQITFQVNKTEDVLATADAIDAVMQKRHPDGDYAIVTPLELLERAETTRIMFMVFMGMIAAISLVVGGIGIMNIMLATVTERTREIGIRRAIGAKRLDIVRQFLAETIVLSTVGGLTGVAGGLTCPWLTTFVKEKTIAAFPKLLTALPESVQDVTPEIVPVSIPIAFGIAVAVGVIFGIYPAIRAASMDPIQALRHQ